METQLKINRGPLRWREGERGCEVWARRCHVSSFIEQTPATGTMRPDEAAGEWGPNTSPLCEFLMGQSVSAGFGTRQCLFLLFACVCVEERSAVRRTPTNEQHLHFTELTARSPLLAVLFARRKQNACQRKTKLASFSVVGFRICFYRRTI